MCCIEVSTTALAAWNADAVMFRPLEATMASIKFVHAHRTWEDWLGIALGVVIGVSPWLAGQTDNQVVMWNAMAVGLAVLVLASFELDIHNRGGEIAEAACGLWLIASPFALAYAGAGQLRYWHFALGAIVVVLAVLEFVQDSTPTTGPTAKPGQ